MPSLIADLLDRLDTERRYGFEERAGTIEFDSRVSRDEAEALALIDLPRSHPAALTGITALEVDHDGYVDTVITTDLEAVDRHFGRESLAKHRRPGRCRSHPLRRPCTLDAARLDNDAHLLGG